MLLGKTIAITGKLSKSRNECEEIIKKHKGTVAKSLTKKVTHLVTNDPTGKTDKLEKAHRLGVQVVGEDFLTELSKNVVEEEDEDEVVEDEVVEDEKNKKKRGRDEDANDANNANNDANNDDDEDANDRLTKQPKQAKKSALEGMIIAMTGKLSLPRDEFEKVIIANGGTYAAAVTKKVTHLVAKDPDAATTKLTKARKNGTIVCGESLFSGLSSTPPTPTLVTVPSEAGDPKPLKDMKEGDVVEIDGNSGTYEIRYRGGTHYCTCPAWRNQKGGNVRTCKHLRSLLGEEFEEFRVGKLSALPASPKQSAPKLMLANKWDESKHDPTGWWISEKYDGLRGYWNGTQFISRLGNPFFAPAYFTSDFPDYPLDGELYLGRKQFEETVSIVKSHNPDDERWQQIRYMVFDVLSDDMKAKPFEERMAFAINNLSNCKYIEVVKQTLCESLDDVQKQRDAIIELGAEGLMLRKPKSQYKGSRTNDLLKVKTSIDEEALVIGAGSRGQGRLADMVGSLECQSKSGKKFQVGSGLTDAMRRDPPKKGSVITFKYQELTNAGIPRFPTFVKVAENQEWPQ